MHVSDHKFAIKRCQLDDLWYVDIVGGESVLVSGTPKHQNPWNRLILNI